MSFKIARPEKASSKGLKILHLSSYNIANVPYLLSKGLNKYTNHQSVCVTVIHPYCSYLKYPEDYMLGSNMTTQTLTKLIIEADIIHIHNNLDELLVSCKNKIDLMALLRNKEHIILHAHGTYHRKHKANVEAYRTLLKFRDIISTPDNVLMTFYPTAFYLQNPVEIEEVAKYSSNNKIDAIAHSPTNRIGKSTHYLETIIFPEIQKLRPTTKLSYIHQLSNEQCLRQRSNCVVNFDQLLSGAYGVGVQESIAQGIVPIVRISKQVDKQLKIKFGSHPFLLVSTSDSDERLFDDLLKKLSKLSEAELTKKTLQISGLKEKLLSILVEVLENEDKRKQIATSSLEWLKRVHDLPVVISELSSYYAEMVK